MINKGILIFACGHPLYGRMAYNLCLTIKAVEAFPVAVIADHRGISHLSAAQRAQFDHIIEVPEDVPHSCGSKLWAYQLTPFKETLLLDADMTWLPRKLPSQLFEEVKDYDFTGLTEGYWSPEAQDVNGVYFFWAKPEEIQQVYKTGINRIYQWRSEVMYFKKSKKALALFKLAQKIWKDPKLSSVVPYAEGVADELGFNIAAAVLDIHPHVYKWQVSYWDRLNRMKMPTFEALYYTFYLASFGSNYTTNDAKRFYDRTMKVACIKLGVQHVFPLQSKSQYIAERRKT